MNRNNVLQIFKSVADDFNLIYGQNKGLHLDYHISNAVVDTIVYNLEITLLPTQEKVSLSCYILLEDGPKTELLNTLELLHKFVKQISGNDRK